MSSAKSITEKLRESARLVDEYMDQVLRVRRPEALYRAARHLIEAGGKRLRPFLLLKACSLVGGEQREAVPLAAAIELLHNFTLIHDDVMDNDDFRRNVPTVHRLWGVPIAIASGDLLFAKVYEAVGRWAEESKPPLERALAIIERVTQASIEICEGQVLDISFASLKEVTEEDYFRMIGGKTAALLRSSAEIGAIAGGGGGEEVRRLGEFAYNAGLAFQLVDDYLGATADEKVLGKPVGSDFREGKKTLIIVHALAHAPPEERKRIMGALGNPRLSREEVKEVTEILEALGSLSYTLERAREYVEKAKDNLRGFPDCEAKRDLLDLVEFFISRKY
ncbi:polyprenyl synthetase family protein [Candidatus Bathyarchaeota archaeon]|nr:MAG: polyprenyl synthetase family protein [Candidatus Bathyarchaeota archaeon]